MYLTYSFRIMKLTEWTFFAIVCAVHAYTSQGTLPLPGFHNQSNVTTAVAKANVAIPVVAHQSQKANRSSQRVPSKTAVEEYYYPTPGASRPQPPDPNEVVMEPGPVKVQGCRA